MVLRIGRVNCDQIVVLEFSGQNTTLAVVFSYANSMSDFNRFGLAEDGCAGTLGMCRGYL